MASLAHSAEVAVLSAVLLGTSETANPYDAMLARIDLELAHVTAQRRDPTTCIVCLSGGFYPQSLPGDVCPICADTLLEMIERHDKSAAGSENGFPICACTDCRAALDVLGKAGWLEAVATCTTCGGYGEQDDGESRFRCRSCHCRECAQPLSKQFGWCVNLQCDAGQAAARGAA